MPFSVIGSETTVVVGKEEVRARKYPWGLAEGVAAGRWT
jgi:septin family protein